MIQCEFCDQPARWCYHRADLDYERFACERHGIVVTRLLRLDYGDEWVTFQCDEVES